MTGIRVIGEPVLDRFKDLVFELVKSRKCEGLELGAPSEATSTYTTGKDIFITDALHLKGYEISGKIDEIGRILGIEFYPHEIYPYLYKGVKNLERSGVRYSFEVNIWDTARLAQEHSKMDAY